MRTGQVDVNGGRYNPLAPFGGYKQSGVGRELGLYGLEEYLQIKSIAADTQDALSTVAPQCLSRGTK